MTLLHLQLLPLLTGVQNVTVEEFTGIDRDRFHPKLAVQKSGPLSSAMKDLDVEVHLVNALRRSISPLRDIQALAQLFRCFRSVRPSILHTHSSKTGILGRFAGRLARVPVIVHTVHGFAFPQAASTLHRGVFRLLELLAGRLSDAVIVLNESDRRLAISNLHIPAERVHVIPNGVDIARFSPLSETERRRVRSERLCVADDDIVCIGMVGRLWPQKNPLLLLEAVRKLVGHGGTEVRVFFIGDGELRGTLEKLIEQCGMNREVRLMGWREDVADLLPALDIFALPSLWEGMPLAILEAMACGVPVVVSRIPGNEDLVEEGVDGLLFEPGDADALSEALGTLAADASASAEMGQRAREKIAREYPIHKRIERIEDLYERLLGHAFASGNARGGRA